MIGGIGLSVPARRAQRGDGDATRAARFRPGPTAAAKARELQLASDKRSPPGFRTIAVLSEEWAGRSLHVKLFGAPDDPYFPEEAEKFARELRGIALGFGPAGSHTIRASLLAETSLMGRFNHRNVLQFDGLLWSADGCSFFLLSHFCPRGNLQDKFLACRARNSFMPDGFVWVCAQAVCEAIEHIHAEIGIAHNNVRMSSVLFDVGGRIRLGDPLPLLVRNALDGNAPQFPPSNGQGRDMKTQQEEQEASTVFKSNLFLAMANDVRNTGEMILELVTLRTIAEHGNVQRAMNHAKEMDKNKFVRHAEVMVKEVPTTRVPAMLASWRFHQNPEDLAIRDERFHQWRRSTQDALLLRRAHVASQLESAEERDKRQRQLTRSIIRTKLDQSDFQGGLCAAYDHLKKDSDGGGVLSDAGFIVALVSNDADASQTIIKTALRKNWKDPLTLVRYAIVTWMLFENDDEIAKEWDKAHSLPEEEDMTRCWMADALCDSHRLQEASVLIADILGEDALCDDSGKRDHSVKGASNWLIEMRKHSDVRFRVNALSLPILARLRWAQTRGRDLGPAKASAAVAVSLAQNGECSSRAFHSRCLAGVSEGKSLVLLDTEDAIKKAYEVYQADIKRSHAAELLRKLSTVDVMARTSLVCGQAHAVYARILVANGEYPVAEFHYFCSLGALQNDMDAGHSTVLQIRSEVADLYVKIAKDSDAGSNSFAQTLKLAAVDLYKSILQDGDRETCMIHHTRQILNAIRQPHIRVASGTGISGLKWHKIGVMKPSSGREIRNPALSEALKTRMEFSQEQWDDFGIIDDIDADDFVKSGAFFFKPVGTESVGTEPVGTEVTVCTPPSVVSWLLPPGSVCACSTVRAEGGQDAFGAAELCSERVRRLCMAVRRKLVHLLVSAGDLVSSVQACSVVVKEETSLFLQRRKAGEPVDTKVLAQTFGWLAEICLDAGDYTKAIRAQQKGILLRSIDSCDAEAVDSILRER